MTEPIAALRARRLRQFAAAVTLVVAVSVVAAACASTDIRSITPASAAPRARGSAATPSPTTAAGGSISSFAVEFGNADVSFAYPAGWHVRRGGLNPGGNESIVFVAPSDLPSECVESAQGGACYGWPVTTVGPNGAIFAWRWFGRPGMQPPTVGDPTTVGGHPAAITKGPSNEGCLAIGGDESIDVTVQPIDGARGWFAIEACLAGPDHGPAESAFEAMLASAQLR